MGRHPRPSIDTRAPQLTPCTPPPPPRSYGNSLSAQVGFNRWQLGGEKLPLAPAGIPSAEGSAFYSVQLAVPADAYEVNMVFSDEHGNHDNNQVGGVGWWGGCVCCMCGCVTGRGN